MDWNSSLALLELPAFGLGLLQERRWFGGTEHANILIHLCLNEHYYFYFSPGAAEIAGSLVEAHGAETCSPSRSGRLSPRRSCRATQCARDPITSRRLSAVSSSHYVGGDGFKFMAERESHTISPEWARGYPSDPDCGKTPLIWTDEIGSLLSRC